MKNTVETTKNPEDEIRDIAWQIEQHMSERAGSVMKLTSEGDDGLSTYRTASEVPIDTDSFKGVVVYTEEYDASVNPGEESVERTFAMVGLNGKEAVFYIKDPIRRDESATRSYGSGTKVALDSILASMGTEQPIVNQS